MDNGTLIQFGKDNMFTGFRTTTGDAIINFGNNPGTGGTDRLIVNFTAFTAGGFQSSMPQGLEGARFVTDGDQFFVGFGGDPLNGNQNPYTANPDPGNTVEINSVATVIGPNNSGLRFTDLNSTSGTVANQGLGVLSVDPNGDVVYVDAPISNVGTCLTPSVFNGNGGAFDLTNTDNFHFIGNGAGTAVNNVIIGATPGCVVPQAKLEVLQSSGAIGSIGILVENTDNSGTTNTTPAIGIKSLVSDNNMNCTKVAGWFEATPAVNCNGSLDQYAIYTPQGGGITALGFNLGANPFSHLLEVNGTAGNIGGAWANISDQTHKTNIVTIDSALQKVRKLDGVYHHWDTLAYPQYAFSNERQVGVIAQNVDSVFPELISGVSGEMFMDYPRLSAVLVEAIKELDGNNKTMQDQIDSLMQVVGNCCNNNYNKTTGSGEGYDYENDPIHLELEDKGAILYQNMPNPFKGATTINYFVPERIVTAIVMFTDEYGRVIKEAEITNRGKGSIEVTANDLATGIYTYSLVIDGKITETKKMVHTK